MSQAPRVRPVGRAISPLAQQPRHSATFVQAAPVVMAASLHRFTLRSSIGNIRPRPRLSGRLPCDSSAR
jgi:hypothetical protein